MDKEYMGLDSLASEKQIELPNSIGMLQNLATLDLRGACAYMLPKEIGKLRKLRHLLSYKMYLNQLKDGIGGMTSLQTLGCVVLDGDGVVELVRELGKLKQLRDLRLLEVRGEYVSVLSSSINEMQLLKKLHITSKSMDEVIDLHLISISLPILRELRLHAKLEKLPKWILGLQNLVKLTLTFSQLTDNPMRSLKNLQNLLVLSITNNTYKGQSLHFEDGGFQTLKELSIGDLDNLNSITIDKGALLSLKKMELTTIPQLKTVPTGIQHLKKLEVLNIPDTPTEFVRSIDPNGGKDYWIVEHVPRVDTGLISKEEFVKGLMKLLQPRGISNSF